MEESCIIWIKTKYIYNCSAYQLKRWHACESFFWNWIFEILLITWNPCQPCPAPVKLCQHWLWQTLAVSTARVHIMERTPPISTSRSVGASELRHGATSRYLPDKKTKKKTETWNMTANILTDSLLELLGREDVQETARLYFVGEDVTINLIWSALIVGALLLCE